MNIQPPYYEVTMPDGSLWGVPLEVIALNRADSYAHEFDGDAERSLNEDTMPLFREDPSEVSDWAQNNMDWKDVSDKAVLIKSGDAVDHQEGWVNGRSKVVFE